MKENIFKGNIVDPLQNRIYSGEIIVSNGKIKEIKEVTHKYDNYIVPGFIDSHIHIESSMLVPYEFARIALKHGTIGAICDSHEIANVLGIKGLDFMIENSKTTPFYFLFSAPSCVPATPFETNGAILSPLEIDELFNSGKAQFLGEVMNFPGVINGDKEIIEKINIAQKYNVPIDGHAPGLRGKNLEKYIDYGITTDHESFQIEEAREKLERGIKIIIREGSAAKNFDELIPLAKEYYKLCMFCSDDKHPNDLLKGHINLLVKRALNYGLDIMKILYMSSVNPVKHYNLDTGLLQIGDNADFLVIDNLQDFNILKTVIKGKVVIENGKELLDKENKIQIINNFNAKYKNVEDFIYKTDKDEIDIIGAIDGQLFTKKLKEKVSKNEKGNVLTDINRDIIKIVVVNRYKDVKPAVGFINGFNLKEGAIASSVAHDSHNIVAIGVNDEDIKDAVNLLIENKGGLSVVSASKNIKKVLPLHIAGLMSDRDYEEVANDYSEIDVLAKELGSTMKAPFMTLSFMALLVIPEIKIGDKGIFRLT